MNTDELYLALDAMGWTCPSGRFLFGEVASRGGRSRLHITDNGQAGYQALCGVEMAWNGLVSETPRRDLCLACLEAMPQGGR